MTNTKISSLRNRKNKKAAAVVVCVIRPACSHQKNSAEQPSIFFLGGGGVGERKEPGNMSFFFLPRSPTISLNLHLLTGDKDATLELAEKRGTHPVFQRQQSKGRHVSFRFTIQVHVTPKMLPCIEGVRSRECMVAFTLPTHKQPASARVVFARVLCFFAFVLPLKVHTDTYTTTIIRTRKEKKKKRLIIIRKEAQPPKGNIEQCRHVSSLPSLCVFCFLSSFLPVAASRTRRQQGGR